MKILLVEPNYKNDFPPIGLMKISQYHKNRGDSVSFYKGFFDKKLKSFDIIYITSLFSFEYKKTLETVKYYCENTEKNVKIFFGGISATIMKKEYLLEISERVTLITGQLTDSVILGFEDNVNIDDLIPDYDILTEIEYIYREADSYFVHLSRGCVRTCEFCAVNDLEPKFLDLSEGLTKIKEIDKIYGVKRNLMIMDNNILYLKSFPEIVEGLISLGFGSNAMTVTRERDIIRLYDNFDRNLNRKQNSQNITNKIRKYLLQLENIIKVDNLSSSRYRFFLELEKINQDIIIDNCEEYLIENKYLIITIVNVFTGKQRIKRSIDFNQGLDARAIRKIDDRADLLGSLNLNPCRIAYDSFSDTEIYLEAMNKCYVSGVRKFSNYLLFNYKDKPEELYNRIKVNIDFCKENKVSHQFSFPMRYAPVKGKNRKFIGVNWEKITIDGIFAIINVTRGVVTNGESFFHAAFGKNLEEYHKIIHMPTEFIKNRRAYTENGKIAKWEEEFNILTRSELSDLYVAYETKDWDISDKTKSMKKFYYKSLYKYIN